MIIGLSGYAGVGKDEVAKVLVRLGYVRLAFADALKEIAYRADPVVALEVDPETGDVEVVCMDRAVDALGWDEAKKVGDTRGFLQRLGVAAREVFGEEVWVRVVENQLLDLDVALGGGEVNAVITDVRFPNELDMIKDFGGFHVRVIREGVTAVNDHISEHALDEAPFDALIDNSGPLTDLPSKVLAMVNSLRRSRPRRAGVSWSEGLADELLD